MTTNITISEELQKQWEQEAKECFPDKQSHVQSNYARDLRREGYLAGRRAEYIAQQNVTTAPRAGSPSDKQLWELTIKQRREIKELKKQLTAQQNAFREKAGDIWDAGHERAVFEQHPYHKDYINNIPPDKETTINNMLT
jgi:hypothetical protein